MYLGLIRKSASHTKKIFPEPKLIIQIYFGGASIEAFKFLAAQKGYEFFQLIVQEITLILLKKNLYKKINFKLKKFIKANLEKAVILEEIKLLLDIMKD